MTRTIARNVVLAAAAAALSLSLTACNGDTGTKDEGAAQNTASSSSAGSDASKDQGADAGSGTGGDAAQASGGDAAQAGSSKTGSSTGGSGTAAKKTPECKVGFLTYKLERRNPEQQGDHLLITAENRSASACTVQKFPVVTPGKANGDVPQAKDDEQPAQPLVVQPGGRIYSAIAVTQDVKAEDDYFTSIRLSLQMNNPDEAETETIQTPGEVEYAGKMDDGIEVYSWNTVKPFGN
ncbi:DUF4232 domain-containing protein [Streptomyces xanthii]|uniref:DUF4232 domain-containing protein n=1 Tax=Streptomyces xanthii TaxID=2768069 RepID=A0A7H1B9D9_9ACTN|nr:DUF4232 domain-containing protein [Streptomyces xanthii]QNS05344.1 DUF4232 domain-containing protein [Streptomyces xanthii]